MALEVTRPEEKVGVAGSDNGRIIQVLDARTRGTGESKYRMLVGRRSRSRRLLTESLIPVDRVPREYQQSPSQDIHSNSAYM